MYGVNMTMPSERRRALRWGRRTLEDIGNDPEVLPAFGPRRITLPRGRVVTLPKTLGIKRKEWVDDDLMRRSIGHIFAVAPVRWS